MAGVLVIDKMLTAFAEEAHATKMEDISYVYHHYNEGFSATWAHKVMTHKDWREKVIQVMENNPKDPEIAITALEAAFRKYASEFFDLTGDQMAEVASDVPNVTVKRIPDFTEAEKEQLIDDYVAYMKDKIMPPVLQSAQVYMVRKAEEVQLQAINSIKEYYNTRISITLQETLPEGATSAIAGYKLRFAPLNENGKENKANWTGRWPSNGLIETSATLIGFMTAGYPHTVEFFKPDADMDSDKPEFVVPFTISVPKIVINVSVAPTFDELVGFYEDGLLTVTEFFVSDELRASLASTAESDDNELGCDFSDIIPAIEEAIGEPNEFPFTITKTGENAGMLGPEDEESGAFGVTYDPVSGILSLHLEDEGMAFNGSLKAKYNSDKTGVELLGDVVSDLGMGMDDMRITLQISGSKPLEANASGV
jgi:hypothetical protein